MNWILNCCKILNKFNKFEFKGGRFSYEKFFFFVCLLVSLFLYTYFVSIICYIVHLDVISKWFIELLYKYTHTYVQAYTHILTHKLI